MLFLAYFSKLFATIVSVNNNILSLDLILKGPLYKNIRIDNFKTILKQFSTKESYSIKPMFN